MSAFSEGLDGGLTAITSALGQRAKEMKASDALKEQTKLAAAAGGTPGAPGAGGMSMTPEQFAMFLAKFAPMAVGAPPVVK